MGIHCYSYDGVDSHHHVRYYAMLARGHQLTISAYTLKYSVPCSNYRLLQFFDAIPSFAAFILSTSELSLIFLDGHSTH